MEIRRIRGIGLLELMLSLAIIAILLIMATRYYQSAHQNQLISQGVDMFAGVQGALQTYRIDNKGTSSLTIKTLVDKGYLPNSYGSGTGTNPWGGKISLSVASGTATITMDSVPTGTCDLLASRVNSTISNTGAGAATTGDSKGGESSSYGATCSSGTVTAKYPL